MPETKFGWKLLGTIPYPLPNCFSKVFETDTDEIWVRYSAGLLLAVSNVCPHKLGPLAKGQIVNGLVECPWHGYTFNLEKGDCTNHPELKLCRYDVKIDSTGQIFVRERENEIL